MKIVYLDKYLDEIEADLEIAFFKKHKYLKANNMFLKRNKLFVKVSNYRFCAVVKACVDAIRYIIEANIYKIVKISLYKIDNKGIQAIVDGLMLGGYSFKRYSSNDNDVVLKTVYIANESPREQELNFEDIRLKIDKHIIVNNCINLTRDMINSVANDTTPEKISNWIIEEIKDSSIQYNLYDEEFIKLELPAFYDISKGSMNKPRLLHLKYNENQGYKKIVLIGKGVTFDTGGISLKPTEFMQDMRLDKAGAITIFGIIKGINDLKLPIEVHAILGFSENMISEKAYKPGDIVKTRKSKTIEIMNTDADGRILLADLFEYAQDNIEDISYIVDYATLSGGVVSAIGQYSAAVIGHSKKLKDKIIKTSKNIDEMYVDLPFNRYFLDNNYESSIADFTNTPSSSIGGGVILGGSFIDSFVDKKYKKKWLHIDISGVSFIKNRWKYHEFGATGFGVKSGIKFIETL